MNQNVCRAKRSHAIIIDANCTLNLNIDLMQSEHFIHSTLKFNFRSEGVFATLIAVIRRIRWCTSTHFSINLHPVEFFYRFYFFYGLSECVKYTIFIADQNCICNSRPGLMHFCGKEISKMRLVWQNSIKKTVPPFFQESQFFSFSIFIVFLRKNWEISESIGSFFLLILFSHNSL